MAKLNDVFLDESILNELRSNFSYLEKDFYGNDRLFFENSGGSLRLKSVTEEDARIASIPDCPERTHDVAKLIREILEKGEKDIRFLLNASNGSIVPSSTASKLMFEIVPRIVEHAEGTNIVTTSLEHPSSFDACQMAADRFKKELRVAKTNVESGSVDTESLYDLIDEDTALLSIILTSNITGAMHDIQTIVQKVRSINPNIYIVVDAVQAAAHGIIDVDAWDIDALNIAPYKMFGNRGMAYAYVSDRVSIIPHDRLLATPENNWNIGSPVPAHYAGFSKIIDYVCSIGAHFVHSSNRRDLIVEGMKQIHLQEQAILNRLIHGAKGVKGIKDMDHVKLYFAKENGLHQDLILAITFENLTSAEAVQAYSENNILVYDRQASSHYSKRILESVELDSIVRVSPLHCHNQDDVDTFLKVTDKMSSL